MKARTLSLRVALSLGVAAALVATVPGEALAKKTVKIKHGTLAPEGSPWFNAMRRLGDGWKKASDGQVELKIYPGGVAGDETDMLRKIKIGQLQSATLTSIGLSRISRSTVALQIPMMFRSYEELDYVRAKIAPRLEKEMADAGFVVLNWGDAGWVHFFSKDAASTPDDFRKLKMFMWAGDPEAEKAWRAAGFQPVPMSATDVMSGLQAGLIDWFGTTPLYALTSQWFGLAKHMVAVRWTPLNGATIISKDAWEKIPAELRPQLAKIAFDEGEKVKAEVRALGDKSIQAMKDRGLDVVASTPELEAQWQKAAEMGYDVIRGEIVPTDLFDEVKRLTAEYRAKNGK
ncbi:MAG: TRAP transporter substrate-binding protein DctP [Deltaproteobacteria bacterium]|nr:TRAP transporter substrate-binding protein DctP [Deltaproteobacteria bacterium]